MEAQLNACADDVVERHFADDPQPSLVSEWPQFGGTSTLVVRFPDGIYVMGESIDDVVSWHQRSFVAQPGELRLCQPSDLLPGDDGVTLGEMAASLPDRLNGAVDHGSDGWKHDAGRSLEPFVLCTDRAVPACFVVADPSQPQGLSTAWAIVLDEASTEAYVWETVNGWIKNGARPMRIPVAQLAVFANKLGGTMRPAQVSESMDLTDILIRASFSRQPATFHAPQPQVDVDVEGTPIPAVVTFRERDMLERTAEWMAGQGWIRQVGTVEIKSWCSVRRPQFAETSIFGGIQSACDTGPGKVQSPSEANLTIELAKARQLLAEASGMLANLLSERTPINVADFRLLTRLREASSESIKVWRMSDGTCIASSSVAEAQQHFAAFLGLADSCVEARPVNVNAQITRPGQPAIPGSKTYAMAISDHIARGGEFPLIVN